MNILDTANKTTSLIIKLLVIGLAGLLILWIILSVIGNAFEGNDIPSPPNLENARYAVTLSSTNQLLFTDNYDVQRSVRAPDKMVYVLHGYFELKDNKYCPHENDLQLDEYYFGDIIITRRTG